MTEFSDKLQVDIEVNADDAGGKLGWIEKLMGAISAIAEKLDPQISAVDETLAELSEQLNLKPQWAEGLREPVEQIHKVVAEYFDVIQKMRREWDEFTDTGKVPDSIQNFPIELQKRFLEAREKILPALNDLVNRSRPDVDQHSIEVIANANADKEKNRIREMTRALNAASAERLGIVQRFVRRMISLAAPLAGLFASKKLFGDYVRTADELGKLSKYIQMNVSDLYTWSKANEAAGGSATAFRGALENWVRTTHRSAEDFIKLGQRMHGMTDAEQTYFLKIHGLSRESMQIFTQSADSAQKLVDTIKETALTEEDYENARKFRQQWSLVGVAVEAVGTKLSRVFIPVVTRVAKFAEDVSRFLSQHSRAIIYFFNALSVILGGIFVAKVGAAIQAGKGLIGVLRALGLAFVASPIGLFVAAIIAAAAAVALLLEDLNVFSEGGLSAFEQLLEMGGLTAEEIEEVRKAVNYVIDAFKELGTAIKPVFDFLLKNAARLFVLFAKIHGFFLAATTRLIMSISKMVDKLRGIFADLLKWIKENLSWEGIKKNLGKLGEIVLNFVASKYAPTPGETASASIVNNAANRTFNQNNNQNVSVVINGDVSDPDQVGKAVGRNVKFANEGFTSEVYSFVNAMEN